MLYLLSFLAGVLITAQSVTIVLGAIALRRKEDKQ